MGNPGNLKQSQIHWILHHQGICYLNLIVKKLLQQRMQMSYMWNTYLNIAFINLNFCVLKF